MLYHGAQGVVLCTMPMLFVVLICLILLRLSLKLKVYTGFASAALAAARAHDYYTDTYLIKYLVSPSVYRNRSCTI